MRKCHCRRFNQSLNFKERLLVANDKSICPLCLESNRCGIMEGRETCWCLAVPFKFPMGSPESSCYCSSCLAKLREERVQSD
ncbi:MAG: cysteine-rich CWC family protein [Oligoflexus sp.]|nr:cysteine-rich CWC family protein [Oligoflexus sp.]